MTQTYTKICQNATMKKKKGACYVDPRTYTQHKTQVEDLHQIFFLFSVIFSGGEGGGFKVKVKKGIVPAKK